MKVGRKLAEVAGVAVAGEVARRIVAAQGVGDRTPFGSLRSDPLKVVADDGVDLHVEIDEPDQWRPGDLTLVFAHGYSLNLDCWHFQRAAYRGIARAVYYDQRSHGRSGRSSDANATIDQCGRDLLRVIESTTDGPVVVIGHSMGGMSIAALAEQHPELFGPRIVGVALISTTAGGLDPGRIIFPMLPLGSLSGRMLDRAIRTLDRGHRIVDAIRRLGADAAAIIVDQYAFGESVPHNYARFVFDMLDATPFEVVADFFPSFASLNKWDTIQALSEVPTTIICGTADKITRIGHSRKLHARIHRSTLYELPGAGHMVMLERHVEVNSELDSLIDHAVRKAGGAAVR